MPIPYVDREFVFRQPDGQKVRVIAAGNQQRAAFRTPDGYTLLRGASRSWEYARGGVLELPQPSGQLARDGVPAPNFAIKVPWPMLGSSIDLTLGTRWRRRIRLWRQTSPAHRRISGPTGTCVGLCLLIEFPDVAGTVSQATVEDFCNGSGAGNASSVRDYFADQSGGKLDYEQRVTRYFCAKYDRSHYLQPQDYPRRARQLIREALKSLRASGEVDFDDLTCDSDGFVRALNVFYAGSLANAYGEGLWPHSSALPTAFELAPGIFAKDYQITSLETAPTLGTFCHENGHMLCDFPDLYDTERNSKGAGVYCLMSEGGARAEMNPTNLCAYLRFRASWAQATTLTSGTHDAIANSTKVFIHRNPSKPNEYFLIENRLAQSRDLLLPSSGLAVWHVDEVKSNDQQEMTRHRHYECALIQADARNDLEKNSNSGDSDDLFTDKHSAGLSDTTQPRVTWWDGNASGLTLEGIGVPGAKQAFKVP